MYDLQSKDRGTWDFFLDGNLSVSKSLVAFCSTGVDHALEQGNRSMKIQGEIKRPVINKSTLRDHYQMTGGTKKRIKDNVGKLKEVMKPYDVTFDKTDSIFNIISKRVLPEKAAEELLDIRNISENIYKEFCSKRLKGDKTI